MATALMKNDFLISSWREKRYEWDPDSTGQPFVAVADQAIVDINNDGRKDAIYREESAVGNVPYDTMILSQSSNPDELSAEILSNDRYHEIVGPPSSVDGVSTNLLRINRRTIYPPGREQDIFYYYVDIIEVAAQRYLIASRAVYWKPTAVTSILEVTDTRHLNLICQFTRTRDLTK